MKKTLAIVLSCVLIVCSFFAVSMITSADTEVIATTAQVTLTDGTVVYLGQQPILNDANKITGYDAANVKPSVAAGDGTVAFDVATGTLTMTNATVAKIGCYTGSMIIDLKGANKVEGSANNLIDINYYANGVSGVLTIRGGASDSLTVNSTGGKYVFCAAASGDLVFAAKTGKCPASVSFASSKNTYHSQLKLIVRCRIS